ncbi:MAG: hypothetical protein H6819_06880 [Phycisphaerales bacterium]|nr:hypothetical protein [Phycisphaerales bacterium]MCB9855305.1 hypothetical protein [Phycisphaerales bacterium]MCB9862898.1 hypothetical protein [Phycisphaerales bacterium]
MGDRPLKYCNDCRRKFTLHRKVAAPEIRPNLIADSVTPQDLLASAIETESADNPLTAPPGPEFDPPPMP